MVDVKMARGCPVAPAARQRTGWKLSNTKGAFARGALCHAQLPSGRPQRVRQFLARSAAATLAGGYSRRRSRNAPVINPMP